METGPALTMAHALAPVERVNAANQQANDPAHNRS